MSRFMSHIVIRLTLLLGIAVGLIGVGFAHRTAAPIDPQLAAFLEVGGTLADLCDDGAPITHWGDSGCEACLLSDTADVPRLGTADLRLVPLNYAVVLPEPATRDAAGHAMVYGARAPPVA